MPCGSCALQIVSSAQRSGVLAAFVMPCVTKRQWGFDGHGVSVVDVLAMWSRAGRPILAVLLKFNLVCLLLYK